MSWFKRTNKNISTKTEEKKDIPAGLWYKTPSGKIIETKELAENMYVSPEDDYHVHIGSKEYFEILFDNKFKEFNAQMTSVDFLKFEDQKKYSDRLNYYSSLEIFNQYNVGEEIISDIERYRNLIETMLVFDKSEITVEEIKRFISSSEKFNFIYGEFDYYMSVSDFIVSLVKSNEVEYSKKIIDKIEDLLIRRVSVFSNLDEEEQIFYIEGITSDINNYSNIINSIELFNSELYNQYKKNLDELLKNIVE